jgi:SAM-dependent methyltransferase
MGMAEFSSIVMILTMARTLLLALLAFCIPAHPQSFEPYEGQPGKDVVWVPTRPALAEMMLDLASITPRDFVMDLGSGDGRLVIAAAKRGARALGVEYEQEMVSLARRNAAAAGVADRAQFIQGDMFQADISKATALVLFLLPTNLNRLVPKFLELPAGTRIVNNTYHIDGWDEERSVETSGECVSWCTALLYLVPAKVAGGWRLPAGELYLTQEIQRLSGTLVAPGGGRTPVEGRVTGERIRFVLSSDVYTGRVRGNEMSGEASGAYSGFWKAARIK